MRKLMNLVMKISSTSRVKISAFSVIKKREQKNAIVKKNHVILLY